MNHTKQLNNGRTLILTHVQKTPTGFFLRGTIRTQHKGFNTEGWNVEEQ